MSAERELRRLGVHTLEDRRSQILAAMREARLDLVLLGSSGRFMIDAPDPVLHLTGFRSVGPCLVALACDGAVRAICAPADDYERIGRFIPLGEAVENLEIALARFLSPCKGRIGTVGFGAMPFQLAESVLRAIGATSSFDGVFYAATPRKTTQELDRALRATRIAESGLEALVTLARPGLRECDLAVQVNLVMKALGADDSFLMLNAGPRAEAVMPSSERPLARGDLILCELSPSVEGQFVQICRTLVLGEPDASLNDAYGLLSDGLNAGLAQAAPNASVSDVCRAIDDRLSEAGYSAYSRPPFIRRRGHGLGAGSIFPGDVAQDNPTALSPGMLFVVHPNQFLPETGYMMCGEPVVVGADGPIVLSRTRAALIAAGAPSC